MTKLGLVVSAAAVLASTSALAADLGRIYTKAPVVAVAPTYNWSGFYVGIQGGGAFGQSRHDFDGGTHGSFDVNGGFIGGTLGLNWQAANSPWVFGIEADGAGAWLRGSTPGTPSSCGECSTRVDAFGTVRGRIGYAWDRWMLYGTGGAAIANIRGAERSFVGELTRTGWTAGGGIEWALAQNWSVKIEYLHLDFGQRNTYAAGAGLTPHSVSYKADLVRAGVNYRFNWGAPVVAAY